MKRSDELVKTLKNVMSLKGITYAELGKRIALSEASVKRIFSQNTFTLRRLDQICDAIGMDMYSLVQIASDQKSEDEYVLNHEEEEFFYKNPSHLAYLHILLDLKSPQKIERIYKITRTATNRYLRQLEKMGFIERLPRSRVRFAVSRNVYWQKNGILRQKLIPGAINEFLNKPFDEKNSFFSFVTLRLSERGLLELNKKMTKLVDEVARRVEYDESINIKTKSVGFLLGIRKWKYSLLDKI